MSSKVLIDTFTAILIILWHFNQKRKEDVMELVIRCIKAKEGLGA